jgi:hypothetical protein
MSEARSVSATFDIEGPGLTLTTLGTGAGTVTSSPTGIECGEVCATNFLKGTVVVLTPIRGLHTLPALWLGCDHVLSGDKCEVTMSEAKAVSATFNLEPQWVQYTLTVQLKGTGAGTVTSAPTGIECGASCSASYLLNTSLTLFATPAAGSEFDHWSVTACGTSPVCAMAVKASRQVNAVFTAVGKRTLTVAKAGSGAGTVTSKPAGIECGQTCSAEIGAAKKVALKATAAKGSKFSGWSGGCTGTKGCRVTMSEARNVTASFDRAAGPPSGRGRLEILSGRAKGKRAQLTVQCFGEAPCQGTLRLIAKLQGAQGQVKGLLIAKAPYSLPAGATRTLSLALKGRAFAQLRSQGHLSIHIGGPGVESRTVRLAAKR